MYFGVDYHPEHWVYPYAGTPDRPEARWERDAQLMVAAGVNVVRMGEFCWGLYEREDGKYDFDWMWRAMDIMQNGRHPGRARDPDRRPAHLAGPQTPGNPAPG